MDDVDYAAIVRSMIEHENVLRDQALNWLVASNGLLMAALGFIWGKDPYLIAPIALVGLIFCVSISAKLHCNTLAIRKLADDWEKHRSGVDAGPRVIALRSAEITPKLITKLYPWKVIPLALTAFWVYILLHPLLA